MSTPNAYEQLGRWVVANSRYPWMAVDGGRLQDKLFELGLLVCDFEDGDEVFRFADGAPFEKHEATNG